MGGVGADGVELEPEGRGWGGARWGLGWARSGVGGLGCGVHPVRRTGTRYNAVMSSGVLQYGAQSRVAVRASRHPFRILKGQTGCEPHKTSKLSSMLSSR